MLENNPILNPKNNVKYNKYFKEFYQDELKEQINDMINNNSNKSNNNRYMNNLTIDRTTNNMVLNGSNIINSFDINNSNNKIEKLSRNFSGVIKNDIKSSNDHINLNYMNYDRNPGFNKMLTNRSMSLKKF